MKVINKIVDMVCWCSKDGIHPVRFRYMADDKEKIIKIDKVVFCSEESFAGIPLKVFKCISKINNENKIFEVKYNTRDCTWILYKI